MIKVEKDYQKIKHYLEKDKTIIFGNRNIWKYQDNLFTIEYKNINKNERIQRSWEYVKNLLSAYSDLVYIQ